MRRPFPATLAVVLLLSIPTVVLGQSPSPAGSGVVSSPSPRPLPACQPADTAPVATPMTSPDANSSAVPATPPAASDSAPCLRSYEEVFVEVSDGVPSVGAVLREYPGTPQSNTLYRERPFKKLRTVGWESLPPIGEAARLCLQGPHGLGEPEATIEQQRGCFLAIRGEWERYLATVPDPEAEAHFIRSRNLYSMASARLGARDLAWLDTALRRELPMVVPVDDDPKAPKTDVNSRIFLAGKQRPVSAASFLRAIRDAQATDRVLAPFEMSSPSWLGYEGGPMPGDGTPDFARRDRIVSVTLTAMCIRPVDTEPPGTAASDGIAFTLPRDQSACWPIVRALWRAYRATNDPAYLDAARTAWDYFRSRFPERPGTPAFRQMTRYNGGLS